MTKAVKSLSKGMRRPSKGIRKHRRRQKAADRRQEARERMIQAQRNLLLDKLPDFFAFRISVKNFSSDEPTYCPLCQKRPSFPYSFKAEMIDTKQGRKLIYICGHCRQRFR